MDPLLTAETEVNLSKHASFLQPLRCSRNFTTLWVGQTLSQFGDAVLWITLPLAVFNSSQSTLQMGLIMGMLMLPQVVLLPFTGIIVDRISRVRIMMLTDTVRCILVAILAFLDGLHLLNFTVLSGFVLVYGAMDALFQPAYSAARAQVFTSDIRNAALSLTQISQQAARLLGPAAGGVLIGFTSVAAGFGLNAVMLLISVISLAYLKLPAPKRPVQSSTILTGFLRELAGGFYELKKHQWLWITILAFGFINIGTAGLNAILVPWIIKVHLGLPAAIYGLVSSASGVGAVLAAFLYGSRSQWHDRGYLAYGGIAVNALALLGLSFVNSTPLLMLLMALASAGIMLFGLVWESSLQELVAEEAYGRVVSLDLFGSWVLLPVGNVLTGWIATQIGGIQTIWIEASFMLCITVLTLFLPAIRSFD